MFFNDFAILYFVGWTMSKKSKAKIFGKALAVAVIAKGASAGAKHLVESSNAQSINQEARQIGNEIKTYVISGNLDRLSSVLRKVEFGGAMAENNDEATVQYSQTGLPGALGTVLCCLKHRQEGWGLQEAKGAIGDVESELRINPRNYVEIMEYIIPLKAALGM